MGALSPVTPAAAPLVNLQAFTSEVWDADLQAFVTVPDVVLHNAREVTA